MSTVKVKLYNSVTSDQHLTTADLPIDGKPHKVRDLFKANNPAYAGKITANTVFIGDLHGATFALASPSGNKVVVISPQQAGKERRFGGDEQPLGDYAAQDYDLSDYTMTATKGT